MSLHVIRQGEKLIARDWQRSEVFTYEFLDALEAGEVPAVDLDGEVLTLLCDNVTLAYRLADLTSLGRRGWLIDCEVRP